MSEQPKRMTRRSLLPLAFLLLLCQAVSTDDSSIHVELDTSEVPHLKNWGEEAKRLVVLWHPRINNLLPTQDFKSPQTVVLKLRKSDKGVGATSGATITVSSHWIEKHPDDLGLVLHELVHVIQSYPSGKPWWLTEGIADYLRWGIYEGKDQKSFPRPQEEQGYKKGYRVAAGFLLWLESDIAPGIVKKLNTAMRNGKYSDEMFEKETGQSLDDLWDAYVATD